MNDITGEDFEKENRAMMYDDNETFYWNGDETVTLDESTDVSQLGHSW